MAAVAGRRKPRVKNPDHVEWRLTDEAFADAIRAAMDRDATNRLKGYRDDKILPEKDASRIPGAVAERAWADLNGLPWDGRLLTVNDMGKLWGTWDVCGVMIRATSFFGGKLLVQERDPDDRPFVLAYVDIAVVTFAGWMTGLEAKFHPYGEFHSRPGHPCHQVPPEALRPVRELMPRTGQDFLAQPCLVRGHPADAMGALAVPRRID